MVSIRRRGSHRLISLNEKNNSELVKWIVIRTPISKLQLALFLLQMSQRSLLHKKKRKWVQQGDFGTSAKALSSSMLHLIAFPIAVVSCTSICNSDKIIHRDS